MHPLDLDWKAPARELAANVAHSAPEWGDAVSNVPRHVLVPNWWTANDAGGWSVQRGPEQSDAWLATAYTDETILTRVGPLHADLAADDAAPDRVDHDPTSSSTLPGLVVTMLGHLDVQPGMRVLDIATGSGYSAGLLAHRLGGDAVLSLDVDPYLTTVAAQRLADVGLHPTIHAIDATNSLLGTDFDRLVSMVSARGVPAPWLAALRPGGRLVTTIEDTNLMVVAEVQPDGTAVGRIAPDYGGFMPVRHGVDYPAKLPEGYRAAKDSQGESVTTGTLPMFDWWTIPVDLRMVLGLAVPGLTARTQTDDGTVTLWLFHRDGSWVRASAPLGQRPLVHQTGPRCLWDELEAAERRWVNAGSFDPQQLTAGFTPDGGTLFGPNGWTQDL